MLRKPLYVGSFALIVVAAGLGGHALSELFVQPALSRDRITPIRRVAQVLVGQLQQERALTVRLLEGKSSVVPRELEEQWARTDGEIVELRATVARMPREDVPPEARAALSTLMSHLDQLAEVRASVRAGNSAPDAVGKFYVETMFATSAVVEQRLSVSYSPPWLRAAGALLSLVGAAFMMIVARRSAA